MKDTEQRDYEIAKAEYGIEPKPTQDCGRCGRPAQYGPVCDWCVAKEDRNGEFLSLIGVLIPVVVVALGVWGAIKSAG